MLEKYSDKILCVDDEANILNMFQRTLGRQYQLYTAASATKALEILQTQGDFALIISDYNMPSINGVEFLKLAKQLAPNCVQIMLTGNIELDVVIKTINETDIFRYLPKPCPIDVLRKVTLDAIGQFHLIADKKRLSLELEQKNLQLAASNDLLIKQKYLLEYELEMAKVVYTKVQNTDQKIPDYLEYLIVAKDTVGGDFVLTAYTEDRQNIYLMLGDLTGHGLQSALAVLLVTEIFDQLCLAAPSLEQLVGSINDKMCRKLPVDLFCAAVLVKLDLDAGLVSIWHGGLPDVYFFDKQGQITKTLCSNNLPLGVLKNQDFSAAISTHQICEYASLFVYSDGVIEQTGADGIMFGVQRLQTVLCSNLLGRRRVDQVLHELRIHQQHLPQDDDISMIELHLTPRTKVLEGI